MAAEFAKPPIKSQNDFIEHVNHSTHLPRISVKFGDQQSLWASENYHRLSLNRSRLHYVKSKCTH